MEADKTISHAAYIGATSSDGYPTADTFADPVQRGVYGWYPGDTQLSNDADYTRRIVQSQTVLVPDATPYSLRDKIIFPAGDEWFVTNVNDYTTGPFGYHPGGEVTVEQVSG